MATASAIMYMFLELFQLCGFLLVVYIIIRLVHMPISSLWYSIKNLMDNGHA